VLAVTRPLHGGSTISPPPVHSRVIVVVHGVWTSVAVHWLKGNVDFGASLRLSSRRLLIRPRTPSAAAMTSALRRRYPFRAPELSIDNLVIGAGVVGLAVARRLAKFDGKSTFLVERNARAGDETR
jgi:hypothetical protein